ncbi:MAG: hypothetical protein K2L80_06535 [Muribaculaceae bacterium]|nr:hypothetical protein [Muribaculaceae bacterium]
MELRELTVEELYREFPESVTPYGSNAFSMLNAGKADRIAAFSLFDVKGKARLGILLGMREGVWRLPFSAPFGEILYRRPQTLDTCIGLASSLAARLDSPLSLTLAADFYDPVMLPRLKGAFATVARSVYSDYNYSYPLTRYGDFSAGLGGNARNHYNRALRAGFTYTPGADPQRVYEVIRRNRAWRGYPLAMSYADLSATAEIVPVDWHLLTLGDADVASAVVYRLNEQVAQVIYWGDVDGYGAVRPMNLLAGKVADYYRRAGFTTLDIGPSSSRGVPDCGLCTFKESLGCDLSFKPTYIVDTRNE